MIYNLLTFCSSMLVALVINQTLLASTTFVGPTSYRSTADIPVNFFNDSPTELEDFEDDSLTSNISASANAIVIGPEDFPDAIDSVDADDGAIDGVGLNGRSLFCSCGLDGITFTFPTGTTAAGLVWTDGLGSVTFEAFGPGGSLGTITESAFVDDSLSGTTAEDRFFGANDAGGITALRISNTVGGIEVDHVQYEVIPEPSSAILALLSVACVVLCARRRVSFSDR